ncbi:hypothetical protein D3C84_621480 [compost metagenome]
MQLVVDHRQLLGAQAQAQLGVGHRLAIRIQQHQAALDRFPGAVVLPGQVQGDFEVRLDVFSHAEGAAVSLVLVAEAQLITTGHGIVRQLETPLSAGLGIKFKVQALQRRTGRIEHRYIDISRGWLHRIPGVLELAPDDFQ